MLFTRLMMTLLLGKCIYTKIQDMYEKVQRICGNFKKLKTVDYSFSILKKYINGVDEDPD